jgi:hypothetical protein
MGKVNVVRHKQVLNEIHLWGFNNIKCIFIIDVKCSFCAVSVWNFINTDRIAMLRVSFIWLITKNQPIMHQICKVWYMLRMSPICVCHMETIRMNLVIQTATCLRYLWKWVYQSNGTYMTHILRWKPGLHTNISH